MSRYSFVAAHLADAGRALARAVVPIIKGGLADLCVLAGVASIAYGLWLMYRPAAWIFSGLVCVAIGLRGLVPPRPERMDA